MPTSIITRGSGVSIAGRQSRGLSPAFSRASAAYQSDGRKVGVGVPRFETVDGRRGVLVEEGTVNLVVNPFFEGTYSSGLAPSWATYGSPSVSENIDVTYIRHGTKSQKIVATDNAQGVRALGLALTSEATYTASCVVYIVSGRVRLDCKVGTVWKTTMSPEGYTGWWYATVNRTANSTAGAFYVYSYAGPAEFYVDAAQCEQKPYATSFVDGARLEERLTIQEGSMSPHGGSIAVRARANVRTGTYQPPFDGRWSFSLPLGLLITGTVVACYYTDPQGTSFSYDTGLRVDDITAWNHYAVTYDGASVVPYLNGVSGVPKAAVIGTNRSDPLRLGVTVGGAFFNGVLSGLSIFRRCLTSSEIAAHMAGDIPSDCYHYPLHGDLWPAPGSLGAVVAPSIITRPGKLEVIGR